ncbi:MAG: hypothetical protein CM15mP106_4580 [Candidatus Neomarinimicrobiota bacterium]|nr:MAG: hypothetical protein CM15mP106_4580 [Candidatus Neomarinimicrobiota bacterium]
MQKYKNTISEWIGYKHKNNPNSKIIKFLQKYIPNMKQDEVELLAGISQAKRIICTWRRPGWIKEVHISNPSVNTVG